MSIFLPEPLYLNLINSISAVPFIRNKLLDKTLDAVEGDLVLRIPCQADGRPKPTVSWTLDEQNIALGNITFKLTFIQNYISK